ncbi:MAG: DUF721 domain-containing protein [Cyanobacteria bacterium]|nr:DUF721 domain-containing protein [Cyanobacteriota bacterium]
MSDFPHYRPKKGRGKPQIKKPIIGLWQVLPQVTKDLALDKKAGEMAMLNVWEECLPRSLKEKTIANRLFQRGSQTVLQVRVKNAAVASELSFHIESMKASMNSFSTQTGWKVDHIELKIGSL